ncbi:hypothetical protein GCM10029964_090000 [Kibdelosporangium lantanae]
MLCCLTSRLHQPRPVDSRGFDAIAEYRCCGRVVGQEETALQAKKVPSGYHPSRRGTGHRQTETLGGNSTAQQVRDRTCGYEVSMCWPYDQQDKVGGSDQRPRRRRPKLSTIDQNVNLMARGTR